MKRYAVIVAGGKGARMGSAVPKQFMLLAGKPILMHTLMRFHAYDNAMQLIVVLPSEQRTYWDELCRQYVFEVPHVVVDGGETRFHSVRNGLSEITSSGLVAVHDGVRPFVAREVLSVCFEEAAKSQAVVPVIDVVETVRMLVGNESKTVDRNLYKLVQTPQVFQTDVLLKAYNQPYDSSFTDDASVVESCGVKVQLVKGNRENIKITTPDDLLTGAVLLESMKQK